MTLSLSLCRPNAALLWRGPFFEGFRMTRSRSKRPPSKTSALALLQADHKKVTELFTRYEKQKARMTQGQREQLVIEICGELKIHAKIEEEIFYPAVREQVENVEELLNEADVEHSSAKKLIALIEGGAGQEQLDATVKVLGEYVRHHVKEEESELFPNIRKSRIDLEALGQLLEARKLELVATKGAVVAADGREPPPLSGPRIEATSPMTPTGRLFDPFWFALPALVTMSFFQGAVRGWLPPRRNLRALGFGGE